MGNKTCKLQMVQLPWLRNEGIHVIEHGVFHAMGTHFSSAGEGGLVF